VERVKISEVKQAIATAKSRVKDSSTIAELDKMQRAIIQTPPQYLRLTKMYETAIKIKG